MEPEDVCTICWSLPTTRAGISGCQHTFCLECIEQWSTRENSCPLCKLRFHRIHWRDGEGQPTSKDVQRKNQYDQQRSGYFISVNMAETSTMRHVLTLGRTPSGFSVGINLLNLVGSEYRPRDDEEHDTEACEICVLMRNIEVARGLRRRSDSDATA